jgi:hypothetical protein
MMRLGEHRAQSHVLRLAYVMTAALTLAGCSDGRSFLAPLEDDASSGLVVSESRMISGLVAFPNIGTDTVAYVSIAPGTLPAAQSVRIRNVTTGDAPTHAIPIADGGFDPVAVLARSGDVLELAVSGAGGAVETITYVVPVRRPPVVVRTNPPKGRTDVALSIRPLVVFSEPIDPQSVSSATVRLLRGATPVSGTPRLVDGNPFTVEFIPSAPLGAASGYEFVITTGLADLQSETLERELRVAFSTSAAPGPGLVIQAASGSDQPGKAGQVIGAPFVVRVIDAQGGGVANVEVMWTVTSGEGALEGRWNTCPDPVWGNVPLIQRIVSPVATTTGSTDADGYARMTFMPTWFGPSTVAATVPGIANAVAHFSTDASDPGARLEVGEEGQFQQAVASEINRNWWFSVTVRDGQGNVVPVVPITWTLTSGAADLINVNNLCGITVDRHSVTSRGGYSRLEYRPIVYGVSTFTASVPGVQGSPLTFTADATVMEVILSDDPWVGLPVVFGGPDYSPDITVPVGATVEFWNRMPSARIVSTSVPPGGTPFDSGMLTTDGRLRVVPSVAGVWTFTDQVSGAVGTLTVHPAGP